MFERLRITPELRTILTILQFNRSAHGTFNSITAKNGGRYVAIHIPAHLIAILTQCPPIFKLKVRKKKNYTRILQKNWNFDRFGDVISKNFESGVVEDCESVLSSYKSFVFKNKSFESAKRVNIWFEKSEFIG